MINDLDCRNKMDVNNLLDWWKWYIFKGRERRRFCGCHWKKNVDDKVEDVTIPLEPVTDKETLIAFRTLHNFIVQFEKTISKLLDAISKVGDELQLDLNFNKKKRIW